MAVVILRLRASLFLAHVTGAPWSIAPHCIVVLGAAWAAAGTIDALTAEGAAGGTLATLLATRGVEITVIALSGALLLPRPPWRPTAADLQRFSLPRPHLLAQYVIAGWGHPLVVTAGLSAVIASLRVDSPSIALSVAAAFCAWANLGALVGVLQTFVEGAGLRRKGVLAVATLLAIALLSAMSGVFRDVLPTSASTAIFVAKLSPAGAPWVAISQPTTMPTLALSVCYLGVLLSLQTIMVGSVLAHEPSIRRVHSSAFEWMPWPGSRVSAIIWRQWVYLHRDSRRLVDAVAGLCLAAIATLFAAIATDADTALRVAVLSVVLIASSAQHNSSALDGTTLWPDILAGVTGIADRSGRIVLPAVVASAASVAGCVVIQVRGDVDIRSLAAFGLTCLSLIAAALSVATVLDVLLSYPPRSSEPSRSNPVQLVREVAANTLALLVPVVCVSPAVAEIVRRVPDLGAVCANLALCLILLVCSVLGGGAIRRRVIISWLEQAQSATYSVFPTRGKRC